MPANQEQTMAFQQYFSSLPLTVQETIKQTSVELQSVEDLRRFAENLMGNPSAQG